jgi:uncharacterized membrane protein
VDDISGDNSHHMENTVRLMLEAEYQESEGFVETKHIILNEDGEEKNRLTQSMREWIGVKLLTSGRNPVIEGRVQHNSLLSKSEISQSGKKYVEKNSEKLWIQ